MRRKHNPGCPCCPPLIQCPTTLTVHVRRICEVSQAFGNPPFLPVEGAVVTARDEAGVLDDVSATTGADGAAVLGLGPGGGAFEVTIETPDGCVETTPGVVLLPCERRSITAYPCCGEVCFEVYDYDTGEPIEGALAPGGPTDAAGIACARPRAWQHMGWGVFQHSVTHPDYYGYEDIRVCFPCDCTPGARADHPTALFPRSAYTSGGGGMFQPRWGEPDEPCGVEERCLERRVARMPWMYKRVMTLELNGPDPVFGGGGGAMELEVVDPDALFKRWLGPIRSGGWAWKVTYTFNANLNNWFVTNRERFDFPAARADVYSEPGPDGARVVMRWRNFLDAAATAPASRGHLFEQAGTPGTHGATRTVLEQHAYCPHPQNPNLLLEFYPFEIMNILAASKSLGQDEVCGEYHDPETRMVPFWFRSLGGLHLFPWLASLGGGRTGMCAPVDVSGIFWCSRYPPEGCAGGYGGRETATYALYE